MKLNLKSNLLKLILLIKVNISTGKFERCFYILSFTVAAYTF